MLVVAQVGAILLTIRNLLWILVLITI